MLKGSSLYLYSSNLGTFWLKIEQFWPFEEISIFSNSGHLEWRAGLSDTILKGTHPGTIPARFGLIWFSGFRGEDLNAIFYQNMPNLHNRYISAERKISQFWKRAIQESFQQSLVDIGSVVSEEEIFLKFHPPFFLICIIGQNRQKFKVHNKSCHTC